MGQEKLYIEKELSWLSFNERVLQEAADKSNPLIERMRFLGIYSNNLDEFYKVPFCRFKTPNFNQRRTRFYWCVAPPAEKDSGQGSAHRPRV
ncbi:polyphosphate kinase [Ewingella americana]